MQKKYRTLKSETKDNATLIKLEDEVSTLREKIQFLQNKIGIDNIEDDPEPEQNFDIIDHEINDDNENIDDIEMLQRAHDTASEDSIDEDWDLKFIMPLHWRIVIK